MSRLHGDVHEVVNKLIKCHSSMQNMGFKGVTHTDTSSEAASKELATKQ